MRGKRLALAVIVLLLVAGEALIYFEPPVDVDNPDMQAQTEQTETPSAVK